MLRDDLTALQREQARANRQIRDRIACELRAGRSERDLARELGRSQPEIHRLATASPAKTAAGEPRRWMTARSAADEIRRTASTDPMDAFRMVVQAIDHLKGLTDPDDIAEWAVTPPPIRDRRFDTLLAALTARALAERGLDIPGWATPTPLPEPWVLAAHPSRRDRVRAQTPPDLAVLNVYVAERDLSRR